MNLSWFLSSLWNLERFQLLESGEHCPDFQEVQEGGAQKLQTRQSHFSAWQS